MNPVTFSFLTGSFLLLAATPQGKTRGTDSIIVNATGSIDIDWLTDKNDKTCNNKELPGLYLKLVPPVPLKRARVVVSRPGAKVYFTLVRPGNFEHFQTVCMGFPQIETKLNEFVPDKGE
ncbi:hypothetical protein RRG08_055569 [Elysia crispata]|uniref:Uncharacterized protein n=1 Tax=Elysia crispata TaxID=231223 RepID=A0AAE0YQS5_9GAST|nr:hypothetical protein RRG08_055569 [Elysia crispata]